MSGILYDYGGAVHFHSDYSYDGNVSIDKIVKSAEAAGLDFIMLTDHFRLDAKRDGHEGWHGNVLLIAGEEISPRYNHYLAFNIDEPIITRRHEDKPQRYIDAVNSQNGFGIIAHPDHEGTKLFKVKPFTWIDWSVKGYTGISIWDIQTDWQKKLKGYPSAILSYFFPSYRLSGPKNITLKRWDELNKVRRVTGIGEIDNHNTKKRFLGFNFYIFNFNYAFRTIRTHILTKTPFNKNGKADINNVFQAIKDGRVYIANEYWNSAKGFSFKIGDDVREVGIGEEFILNGRAKIKVNLPHKGLIRTIRDGEKICEIADSKCSFEINNKGLYRVEVYQKVLGRYKPWIYSNHINVR